MFSASFRAPTGAGKVLVPAIAVILLAAGCAAPGHAGSSGGSAQVAELFQAHVNYLASDELEGRGVGTPGLELAADYIADQFRSFDLLPGGDNGTYFQTFEMAKGKELGGNTYMALSGISAGVSRGIDYTPLSFTSSDAFEGGIVFCGYGIDDDEHSHHDFAHLNVAGKVLMILRGEPSGWTDPGQNTPAASFRAKAYAARERDAAAVLFVSRTPDEGDSDELIRFDAKRPDAYGIPAMHLSRKLADRLLAAGGLEDLPALQAKLDGSEFCSAALDGIGVSGQVDLKLNRAAVRNVVGIVRGKGRLADQYVVIGAHYDHLGKVVPMQRTFKAGKLVREKPVALIHNGADDNASGTAGLIELARRFASGAPTRRSIAFVAFTAEESGLHGSDRFVEHVPLPGAGMSDIVAMLNMDMIGRMPKDRSLEVFGVGSGEGFDDILARHAENYDVEVAPVAATSGRSDDAPFYRKNVPSLHFCTGTHKDYHKPSDDSDKIDADGAAQVVGLVGAVARELANAQASPKYVAGLRAKTIVSGASSVYRVVMGLTPGYGEDGLPGMKIPDVSPDGPAAVAGMKPGDRIVRIDKLKVNNIQDYMGALTKNRPGDVVEVEITRGGKKIVLSVTLAPAG